VLLDGDEFGLTLQETEDIISAILSYAQLVHPTAPIPAVSRDPKDNHILALAKETTASAIVTRDKDLLVLKTYDKIPIQPPEAFLKRLVTDQVLQS